MTRGGFTARRAFGWSAFVSFVLVASFGMEFSLHGSIFAKGMMAVFLAVGIILVGAWWAAGFERHPANAEEDEWQDAIK